MHTILALHGMSSIARTVGSLAGHLRTWSWRARQRHDLAQLDDWLLQDLGLTRDTVQRECLKYPWQR